MTLDSEQRLTALAAWKNGDAGPGVWFVDVRRARLIEHPAMVNWTDFPETKQAGCG